LDKVTTDLATQTAPFNQHDVLNRGGYQQMIQADLAKFIHDHRYSPSTRLGQQPVQKSGFPTAQKPRDDQHGGRFGRLARSHGVHL
jgi:hypothetical protein